MNTARDGRLTRRVLVAAAAAGLGLLGTVALAGRADAVTYAPQVTIGFTGVGFPTGVAVDSMGDVFVADGLTESVYERTPGGVQSTLADGLSSPEGLALDSAGDVFVAEIAGGRVLELPSGQQFFALTGPVDVAVDSAGNLFEADVSGGGAVRELFANTGGTSTVLAVISQPGGVAVDPFGNVYVADVDGNQVLEIGKFGTQVVLPITGLSQPHGLAFDQAGNLFVADSGNHRVVELSASGTQSTLGFVGLSEPVWLATDVLGDVYVTDQLNGRVLELPAIPATGTMTLNRSSGPPGSTITSTSLTPCPGGANSVRIVLYSSAGTALATGQATLRDSSGDWAGTITVPPDATPGSYLVSASCSSGRQVLQNYTYIAFTVTAPVRTSTSVTSSASHAVYGQPVTFTASVGALSGSKTPGGSVTFSLDGAAVDTETLSDGIATDSAPLMSVGAHTVTATYSPAPGFLASSGSLTQTVAKAPVTLVAVAATKAAHAFSATLTRADTGAPIQGQTITFSTRALLGKADPVCSAVTNSTGVASCTGTIPAADKLFDTSYTATYLTTADYLAATATARLS